MKKNKIFYVLITIVIFVSLFIAPYIVMSDTICCFEYKWTSTVEVGGGELYLCCYADNTCTQCIIVTPE